jgi:hypothetical protein
MPTHASRGVLAAVLPIVLAACAAQPQIAREGAFDRPDTLFDPALAIRQDWVPMALTPDAGERRTDYRLDSYQDRLSIRAEGRRSASGLVLPVDFDAGACPFLEWHWRVEKLQDGASLFDEDLDDVAAALYVVFGDPAALAEERPVTALRYVWTTGRVQDEEIVDSPRQPGVVRSIVVQGGLVSPLAWAEERRDIAADYQAAFGRLPAARVRAVALFTDNDDTQEPAVAHYGAARLLCAAG